MRPISTEPSSLVGVVVLSKSKLLLRVEVFDVVVGLVVDLVVILTVVLVVVVAILVVEGVIVLGVVDVLDVLVV